MSSTEEQLLSFFLYSMFIYPVTNYLVSPHRKYSRVQGAIYAILFLLTVSSILMWYENREVGPNHYATLSVTRSTTTSSLKKAFRNLSLELHPDKNKSPTAIEDFRKVKQAFDVLSDPETRRIYEKFGDYGVKLSSQSVMDHKVIIIQMVVYYSSSAILAFLMTFSEPTGDAFSASMFGMAVMLLIEALFVLEDYPLPPVISPYHTPHNVISTMHRLFPAFMSGCRCIIGAFLTDKRGERVEILTKLAGSSKALGAKTLSVVQEYADSLHSYRCETDGRDKTISGDKFEKLESLKSSRAMGLMERALGMTNMSHFRADSKAVKDVESSMMLIRNPHKLSQSETERINSFYETMRNIGVYLLARLLFGKTSNITA